MFKKYLINKFNKKFAGKELMFCPRIFTDMSFLPSDVLLCCHCTKMPYNPPKLFPKMISKFNFFEYIKNLDRIMTSNQSPDGVCRGCIFLEKQIVPKLPYDYNINFITINHFTKCNSNCVYCIYGDLGPKTQDIKYHLLPILKQMLKQKMLKQQGFLFNWGGGEPTICSEFKDIVKFAYDNKLRQAINSSGVEFSDIILDGLKDGAISIQISPDAGTAETYKSIKRQDNFDDVWYNIKKYAIYPDMLFVKYIFFSLSANETDVVKFIDLCVESGVKNIVIDCETNSSRNPESTFGPITNDIVNLAILMKRLAVHNNINYEVSYQWSQENRDLILNSN